MIPLSQIGSTIQDFNRFGEILTVLTKHGFGFLIGRLNLGGYLPAKERIVRRQKQKASTPTRVRQMLEELGPTFIKMGQVLSMRPDILPDKYIQELSKLQDRVPPFTEPSAEQVIRQELGGAVSDHFKSFSKTPFAAASIAQVHHAVTRQNKKVVIKIQRPGLKRKVESDLEILRFMAKAWENIENSDLPRRPVEFVDEFERIIHEELDFLIEARHLGRFKRNFKKRPGYRFPEVYWNLTTSKCLTLEYIDGIKLSAIPATTPAQKKKEIAQALFDGYILMTLEDCFFHADPHAGNFILAKDNALVFLDAGQVGRLDNETVAAFTDMLLALEEQDVDNLVDAYLRLGTVEEGIDRRLLKREVGIFLEQYYDVPIEKISFGRALQDLVGLSTKFKITLPPDFIVLAKTFLGAEGVGRKLNPKLNLIDTARPIAEKIILKRYQPRQIVEQFYHRLQELYRFLSGLPNQMQDLLGKLQHGKLKMEFEHKGLEGLQHNIDRTGNRVSFALVVAALIIGSSLILASQVGPQWGGFSILGLIGFLLAGLFGLLLIIAILRSGKM
ncbi:AarF/ABC1/UbiB kinase family protein [bacterium]|nr:AarF/ABC1/UbiB kinase family protein [bacterium]